MLECIKQIKGRTRDEWMIIFTPDIQFRKADLAMTAYLVVPQE